MKISPVRAELFQCGQTDRQTDMTELMVAFCNFTNARKNRMLKYATPCSFYVQSTSL